MKLQRFIYSGILLLLAVGILTACSDYYETPEDCGPDEVYDEVDQLCYLAIDCQGEDCEVEADYDDYYELPEDCWDDEVYDEVDRLCYPAIDCEGEDCEVFDDDLITLFFDLVDEFFSDQNWETEAFESEGEEVLVTYQIEGNRIQEPEEAAVSDSALETYQDDTATHQKIWDYFADMIPLEQRGYLTEFVIFTDGPEETMAAVEQDTDDPAQWVLAVDIADAGDPEELTYTLIHEYGHLLTLNPTQVEPDTEIFYNPDDEDLYEQATEACPEYFPGEGCSFSNAYINIFVERFWSDIYDEWTDINLMGDEDAYYEALDDFYYDYEDQFVTDYAATSPEEDIAESWTYFILKPKPGGNTRAEEKVLFFYEWDELVKLRAEIVSRTYSRLRRR